MSNIIYHKGNLFDAPEGSVLVHSCNSQGIWGAGIAKIFKERNPNIYKQYNEYCQDENEFILGTAPIFKDENDPDIVACLMTSGGGSHSLVDGPYSILKYTDESIGRLINNMEKYIDEPVEIHMPKINAGIFRVPWEYTAEVLQQYKDTTFNVWICD